MHLIFHMLRWYFHKQFMTYLRSMNFPMRLVPSRVLSLYTSNSTPSAFFYYYYAGDLFFNFLNSLKFLAFIQQIHIYILVTHVLHFFTILIKQVRLFILKSMNFIINIMIHQLKQIGNLVEINFFSWKFSANLKYNSQFFIAKNAPYF